MDTSAVSGTGTITYAAKTETKSNNNGLTVNTDTFLKLLVAQIQYQDPLEPQSDTQFVTQLAQMSSMEQMQAMNATLTSSQAYDMLGKYVYAEVVDEKTGKAQAYMGKVTSAFIENGNPYVMLGDIAIPMDKIKEIFDPSLIPAEDPKDGTDKDTNDTSQETTGS